MPRVIVRCSYCKWCGSETKMSRLVEQIEDLGVVVVDVKSKGFRKSEWNRKGRGKVL